MDYDSRKFSVDVSDQLASYNTALRRCTKWYRKLIIEVIWGTALVNAYFLYTENTVSSNKLIITEFREKVICLLVSNNSTGNATSKSKRPSIQHHLVSHQTKNRARCVICYKKYGKHGHVIEGKKKLAAQIITICDKCEGNPYMCSTCFIEKH